MLETLRIDETPNGTEVYINEIPLERVRNHNSPTGRAGVIRQTFMSDEYIVKFGSVGESRLVIDEEDRQYFAETVYVDINRQWLVQRRIHCEKSPKLTRLQVEAVYRMAVKYKLDDVYIFDSSERTEAKNWIPDIFGVPKIFDYDYHGGIEEKNVRRWFGTEFFDKLG